MLIIFAVFGFIGFKTEEPEQIRIVNLHVRKLKLKAFI